MNETRQAGSLHDRERFLSGAVTNSTNSFNADNGDASSLRDNAPRCYRASPREPAGFAFYNFRHAPPTSFPFPGWKGISKKESAKNRERHENIPSSTISALLDHDLRSTHLFPRMLISERGCNGSSQRIGVLENSYSMKKNLEIGADQFFREQEIFLKNGRNIERCRMKMGNLLSSQRGFKRSRLSERMVGDKMMVEISLNRVRRGK